MTPLLTVTTIRSGRRFVIAGDWGWEHSFQPLIVLLNVQCEEAAQPR
jgi:flavin reductase (DIM6/NTAB) family NADH-FMN oxidoreductase RutF